MADSPHARKPRLLLAWGNPYNFEGVIAPSLAELARHYEVFVMLVDFHLPEGMRERLEAWNSDGTISGHMIVPSYFDTARLHPFMARSVRELRRMAFDIFLSLSMIQVWERYLLACALPPNCLKVCFLSHLTPVLANEALARRVLGSDPALPPPLPERPAAPPPAAAPVRKVSVARALRRLAGARGERRALLAMYAQVVWIGISSRLRFDRHQLFDRYLLPMRGVGRVFPYRRLDRLTELATDQFDALVVLDPLEARLFGALLHTPNVFLARHPLHGRCRCGSAGHRSAILSPLSGFEGDSVAQETLDSYLRDLSAAVAQSGAQEVHLRLHPREGGRWPEALLAYLAAHGLRARIVPAAQPIGEVVCDYLGVVGFASAALRDARAGCDQAFVVGLVRVSRALYSSPKLVMGEGEGIGWIEDDGSFVPDTFQRRRRQIPERPVLSDLLSELAANKARSLTSD